MKTKTQIVSELIKYRDRNRSAINSIESIKENINGILINFFDGNCDINWCLNEILMIAKMAKLKLKKDEIFFGYDKNSLLIPNNALFGM